VTAGVARLLRAWALGFAEPLKALTRLAQKQNKNAKAHVDVWQQPQRPTGTHSPPFGAMLFFYLLIDYF
jgi:hypothetical protein